jgi:hypothetical protein
VGDPTTNAGAVVQETGVWLCNQPSADCHRSSAAIGSLFHQHHRLNFKEYAQFRTSLPAFEELRGTTGDDNLNLPQAGTRLQGIQFGCVTAGIGVV